MITPNSPLSQQSWRAGLVLEAERATPTMGLVGTTFDAPQILVEREGQARGSQVTVNFGSINYDDIPKGPGAPPLGEEAKTDVYSDTLWVRYFKFDGKVDNMPYEQGQVSFDLKDAEVTRVGTQWGYMWGKWAINHLVGNTLVNTVDNYALSGGNVVTAMDTEHTFICPKSDETTPANEASLDSTCLLTTKVIDEIVKRAGSRRYVSRPFAPATIPGLAGRYYIFEVSSDGYQQIMENSPDTDMREIAKAAISGGADYYASPLATSEGMIYGSTLIIKNPALDDTGAYAPRGLSGGSQVANTAVAAFYGAQATHWCFGEGFTDGDHLGFVDHQIKRYWSFDADTVAGVKRTIVNDKSWASMRVVHYSKA